LPAGRLRTLFAGCCEREAPPWRRRANLVEVLDVLERVHAVPTGRVLDALDHLVPGVLQPVALDYAIACRAGQIRARHYHRSVRPISLADAVLVASAGVGDRVATADPAVLAVAAAEGVATVPLPGEG
jgi:hypothetical protein